MAEKVRKVAVMGRIRGVQKANFLRGRGKRRTFLAFKDAYYNISMG